MKLFNSTKMSLKENYSKICIESSAALRPQNGVKQEGALLFLAFKFALVYVVSQVHRNPKCIRSEWDTSASGLF
jgi:hypothetical protein